MNYRDNLKRLTFFAIFTIFSTVFCYSQVVKQSAPYENKLLNGLKLFVWTDPTAEKVSVKLRIHSGAAFDPKDKMGVMALLGEILFPSEQSRDFFTEDLEGNLDITTTYDYIQITATGKSSEILSIIETISKAVVTPQVTAENFKLVQTARIKKVQEMEKNPNYLADRAVAKRLLGEFPYGRTAEGTTESLSKIDRADILFAKERFLSSDNASITFVGNVKPDFVYRATRQLFGNWTKSDKKIPATFTMPNEPDLTPQKIDFTPAEANLSSAFEIRFATRGFARNDKDYWAIRFLADVLQNRFRSQFDTRLNDSVSVVHERNLLPSLLNFKISVRMADIVDPSKGGKIDLTANPTETLRVPISTAEFEQTRAKILGEIDQKPMADKTLDVITYKLGTVKDEIQRLNSVTQADLQRVADKLAKQTFVSVTVAPASNKQ
ncbi:MAG: insulinase family protein [Acidobacteriota bacterium]